MLRTVTRRLSRWEPVAAKVPEIALIFWVLKVLTTGIGESMSDFLSHKSIPLAALIGIAAITLGMTLQFRARRYRAPVYWFAVLAVAVFGTMAADGVHKGAGVPYAVSTVFFAVVAGTIFFLWHRAEGTLSIHSITTTSRELYYWAAVLATFALGTAAGDFTAYTLNLGFFSSVVVFAILIAIPAVAWQRGKLDPIAAFWCAYVLTRPLGASIADWLGKSSTVHGLGMGDGLVSAIGLAVFVVLVAYLTVTRRDIQPPVPRQGRPVARAADFEAVPSEV